MASVVYLGNFTRPWCTEVHIARDLEYLGHRVRRIQEPIGGGDKRFLRQLDRTVNASGADLFLWTRTWSLPPVATDLWRHFEANGTKTASYHLDLYLGLQREANVALDPFWTTGYVFTPDGNETSESTFKAWGINHHWMPPAMVSDEVVPGVYREELAHDVIFVGSYHYHEEWPWRPKLIDYLADYFGPEHFAHYGGTPETTIRTDFLLGEDKPGLWLNDLYASCKVVVGDSLSLPGNTRYISDRYMETLGRGGCLMAPRVPVLSELGIDDGVEYISYEVGKPQEVVLLAADLIDDEMSRFELVAMGRAAIAEGNTYKHRLHRAFEIMEIA